MLTENPTVILAQLQKVTLEARPKNVEVDVDRVNQSLENERQEIGEIFGLDRSDMNVIAHQLKTKLRGDWYYAWKGGYEGDMWYLAAEAVIKMGVHEHNAKTGIEALVVKLSENVVPGMKQKKQEEQMNILGRMSWVMLAEKVLEEEKKKGNEPKKPDQNIVTSEVINRRQWLEPVAKLTVNDNLRPDALESNKGRSRKWSDIYQKLKPHTYWESGSSSALIVEDWIKVLNDGLWPNDIAYAISIGDLNTIESSVNRIGKFTTRNGALADGIPVFVVKTNDYAISCKLLISGRGSDVPRNNRGWLDPNSSNLMLSFDSDRCIFLCPNTGDVLELNRAEFNDEIASGGIRLGMGVEVK